MFEHDPVYQASHYSTYAQAGNKIEPQTSTVIDFSNGEITDAWDSQSITLQRSDFNYQPTIGQTILRQQLVNNYYQQSSNLNIGNIVVTNGAKHGLLLAIKALIYPSKKCLCPLPCWEAYSIMLTAYGAEIIHYDPLDVAVLKVLIQQHPNAVVLLNYPHNPTGKTLTNEEMETIIHSADLANSTIISDEVYRCLVPNHPSAVSGNLQAGKVIVIDSLSKWCSAAGLRIGWMLASEIIIKFAVRDISLSVSGASSAAQAWALIALRNQDIIPKLQAKVTQSTAILAQLLTQSGHQILSQGVMYLWVSGGSEFTIGEMKVRGLSGRYFGDVDACRLCACGNPEGFAKLIT